MVPAFSVGTLGVDPRQAGVAAATVDAATQVGGSRDSGVIRSLAVDDLLREAELEMTTDPVDELGAVLTVPHVLDGPPDLRRVTPNLTTRVVELAALLGGCIRAGRAGAVPDVGV